MCLEGKEIAIVTVIELKCASRHIIKYHSFRCIPVTLRSGDPANPISSKQYGKYHLILDFLYNLKLRNNWFRVKFQGGSVTTELLWPLLKHIAVLKGLLSRKTPAESWMLMKCRLPVTVNILIWML